MRNSIPKYVEKALKDRTEHIELAREAEYVIDEYAAKIGLDERHPDYKDACLCTDIRIYTEVGCAEDITRQALMKVLSEKRRQ